MRSPEIHLNTLFGKDIVKYLSIFNIKKAIEIGSGSGNGSTQCFLKYFDSVNDDKKELHCFEPVLEWYNDLKNNTNNKIYCKLYNTSSISYNDFLVKNFDEDFYNTEYNKLKNSYSKDILKTWYDEDLKYFKNCKDTILSKIEAEAILIDGCEFSGYSEYKKINKSINLIFLDDCFFAFKTNQIFIELSQDKNWTLVTSNNSERNGYAIFRKKI